MREEPMDANEYLFTETQANVAAAVACIQFYRHRTALRDEDFQRFMRKIING